MFFRFLHSKLVKIKLFFIYHNKYRDVFLYRKSHKIKILRSKRTIKYVIRNKLNVSRFGDGELNMMFSSSSIGFQIADDRLTNILKDVFKFPNKNVLICLNYNVSTVRGLNQSAASFWLEWAKLHYKKVYEYIDCNHLANYKFGCAGFTRPYMSGKNKKKASKIFNLVKKFWDNKNLIVVEGDQTRLGATNDLLDNAKDVKRIIAPSVNAFSKYDEIVNAIRNNYADNSIVILALGPTATVLAYTLAKYNIWAIDIGHIDVEYEWFLMNAQTMVPVRFKYVNEVEGGNNVESFHDEKYENQIIVRV